MTKTNLPSDDHPTGRWPNGREGLGRGSGGQGVVGIPAIRFLPKGVLLIFATFPTVEIMSLKGPQYPV